MCSNNKTQVSTYDPTKLAIQPILRPEDDLTSNCGQNFKKTVSFDDIVHFIDEENIVRHMMILIVLLLSTLKLPQKTDRSTEKGSTIPDPVKNPRAFPVTINITEQHKSIIFLNPYNLWDMVPTALMSLKYTNVGYSMSNQYPQPTTHQPTAKPEQQQKHLKSLKKRQNESPSPKKTI